MFLVDSKSFRFKVLGSFGVFAYPVISHGNRATNSFGYTTSSGSFLNIQKITIGEHAKQTQNFRGNYGNLVICRNNFITAYASFSLARMTLSTDGALTVAKYLSLSSQCRSASSHVFSSSTTSKRSAGENFVHFWLQNFYPSIVIIHQINKKFGRRYHHSALYLDNYTHRNKKE